MKKSILVMAALAAIPFSNIWAEVDEPKIMENFEGLAISPDGRYVASDLYGCVEIYDTDMGESIYMLGNGETTSYGIGMGSPFNADGSILVGSATECGGVGYYKNYAWHKLNTPNPQLSNIANSITPDSRRICGAFGMVKISTDDTPTPMMVPGFWQLKEDGTYGDPVMLPYPEKDFSGRTPQYVTAKCISDDGKTIAGCIRDYSGFVSQVIVYTEDAEGNWTYTIPSPDFYNPTGIVFPKWPGEAPSAPNPEDFLTDSEKNSYEVAHHQWEMACTLTGEWDYDAEPEPIDYLTGESKEIFDEATKDYEILKSNWEKSFDKFSTAFSSFIEKGHSIPFNLLFLRGDGKSVVSGTSKSYDDPNSWYGFSEKSAPVIFNLEENTYKLYSFDDNAMPSSIADDGSIFAVVSSSTDPQCAVVYNPGEESAIPLYKYMQSRNPVISDWIIDNMYHDLDYYDFEIDQVINIKDVECTGIPRVSRDITTILTNVENLWDYTTDSNIFCYILPGSDEVAVRGITADINVDINVEKGGIINICGQAKRIIVATTDGRVVYDAAVEGNSIATGLEDGLYIVTVVNAKGRKSVKAMF